MKKSAFIMNTNLQFFAEDRTNMVSLLDIGTLIGSTAKIVEMGDGVFMQTSGRYTGLIFH